jgi:hypothetical protein
MLKILENDFLKTSRKSVLWAIGTLFFGLLQLLLVLTYDLLTVKDYFKFHDFVFEGSLLFFSAAVVSSITIDYLLSMKAPCCKPRQIFLLIMFPSFIILCCVALFFMMYGKNPDEFRTGIIYFIELGILIATMVYGLFIKYHAFKP